MKTKLTAVAALALTCAWATTALAQAPEEGADKDEKAKCFECHDDDSLDRELGDGTTLSVNINPAAYAASAHSDTDCTECHKGAGYGDDHPDERAIASRKILAAEMSKACVDCHDDFDEGSQHAKFATGAPYPACSTCHNPHTVTSMEEWKKGVSDRDYCLTCHSKALPLAHIPGDKKVFAVDGATIAASVHSDHKCTDCHTGFSKDKHPITAAATTREHSIAMAKTCMDCHDDKAADFKTSIHAKLIADGNKNAPVCTDCHGFHDVAFEASMREQTGQACAKCHTKVADAYAQSVHGKAHSERRESKDGHPAPVCSDCHSAHKTVAVDGATMRATCTSCHADASKTHAKWLPNTELHLNKVACVACHAKGAKRQVNVKLKGAASTEVLAKLKAEAGEAPPSDEQVADALADVQEKDVTTRMGVSDGIDAHHIALKGEALSDCTACHTEQSEAFRKITLSANDKNGQDQRIETSGDVLSSVTTLASVNEFYALGGTRIPLFDYLLLLGVLGAIGGIMVHFTARKIGGKKKK